MSESFVRNWKMFLLIGTGVFIAARSYSAESVRGIWPDHACTSSESWTFDSRIPKDWQSKFVKWSQSSNLDRSFTEVSQFRGAVKSAEAKSLSEYWLARSLFEAGLYHPALQYFSQAAKKSSLGGAGIQVAAIQCILELNRKIPSLLPDAQAQAGLRQLADLDLPAKYRSLKAEAGWVLLRQGLAKGDAPSVQAAQRLMSDHPAYAQMGEAWISASVADYSRVIQALEPVVKMSKWPERLESERDHVWVMLGQAYYSVKEYKKARDAFKKVTKQSNYLAEALSDQAWSEHMLKDYGGAIGLFLNLQTGHLRRTYAPEGAVIAAISLFELCQYPEALKATRQFRKLYKGSFQWLTNWNKKRDQFNLYRMTVAYLHDEPSAPEPVVSEWVRSPYFLAQQEELNLVYDEKEILDKWVEKAASHENQKLEKFLVPYVSANTQLERQLVGKINDDLTRRSERMLSQLSSLAENVQLVEIDIYNRASDDLIQKNFNPEFSKKAKKVLAGNEKVNASDVWEFGRFPAEEGRNAEVWEDEIGALNARLPNNCKLKEKSSDESSTFP